MKLVTANGKEYVSMTRTEWEKMGKDKGWMAVEAKKKGKAVNPWAVCNSKIDQSKNPEKFERCVQDVKKEHPVKKD